MDWLLELAQRTDAPLIVAFAIGLISAVAPCPLATNITATVYIARQVSQKSLIILSGILYTFGRMVSYSAIAAIIYFGANEFNVAKIFQGTGEKLLGFILLLIGLIMLNIIKVDFIKSTGWMEKAAEKLKQQGMWGAFWLGAMFALAFCPYSGALFFGMLVPMTIGSGLAVPVLFSLGTGLPVILFAFIIAYSIKKLGIYFKSITKIEKVMRVVAGIVFILTGLFYIGILFGLF